MLEVFLTMECWCFLIRINGISRIRGNAMSRVFSQIGFNILIVLNSLVLNQDFQDFEDWKGGLRFGCKGHSYIGYFIPFFSSMRYAPTRGFEMKARSNNNFPTQINDVIINPRNPENPDSNNKLLRA